MRDVRGPDAIILAAGLGSRLAAATVDRPKCLVQIGERAILDFILDACEAAACQTITVVTGYRREDVFDHVMKRKTGATTECVDNEDFATTGTAASLKIGLGRAPPEATRLLLIEGDTAFAPAALDALLDTRGDVTFAASPYNPSIHSGTRLIVDGDGGVTDVVHAAYDSGGQPQGRSYKTANIGLFDSLESRRRLRVELDRCLAVHGPTAPAELAFKALVDAGDLSCRIVDLDGIAWFEVDDATDLKNAEALFARARD